MAERIQNIDGRLYSINDKSGDPIDMGSVEVLDEIQNEKSVKIVDSENNTKISRRNT